MNAFVHCGYYSTPAFPMQYPVMGFYQFHKNASIFTLSFYLCQQIFPLAL